MDRIIFVTVSCSAERERAREQDQREKEELEERLREKDAASTKKVGELGGRVQAIEETIRDELLDEEHLFGGLNLTAKEKAEYKYKKEVYELAKQRAKDVDNIVVYHMPEAYDKADRVTQDKRFVVALKRYRLEDFDVVMDVPIEEEGGTNIHEECEGGKRRRLMKVRSVVDWVEDVTSDTESPNLLSEGDYVIRLSNTERQVGDPALENRDCIVATKVDDKGKVGRLFTLEDVSLELSKLQQQLQQRTSTLRFIELGLSEPVVCAEAFKLLEKDFSSILKNEEVVDEATEIVSAAAKRQNWPIASSGWVNNISFGVFVEAVLMLNIAVTDGMAVRRRYKEKLCNLKDKLTEIFWAALDEGISVLEENELYAEGQDSKIASAITFLRNKDNLVATLNEWIANSHLRTTRNSSSYPFSGAATNDVKAAALKYYDIILNSNFSEKFRHVGELGRLKLSMDVTSSTKMGMKGGDKNDIKEALLQMYGNEIDGPDVDAAGSSGSSNSD